MPRIINKLSALFGHRCPRCEQGKMFKSKLFDFKHFMDMPARCERCDLVFTPEPGFYMGAMFISYGLFSFGMLFLVALFYLAFHIGINMSIFLAVLLALISFTYIMRLSRTITLHIVRSFNTAYSKK